MLMEFITTVPALAFLAVLAVIIGGIFLSKALLIRKSIRRQVRVPAHTHTVGKGIGAGISWIFRGEEFHSAVPYFYSISPGEEIHIYVDVTKPGKYILDTWTHNGKLDYLISATAFICAIILTLLSSAISVF